MWSAISECESNNFRRCTTYKQIRRAISTFRSPLSCGVSQSWLCAVPCRIFPFSPIHHKVAIVALRCAMQTSLCCIWQWWCLLAIFACIIRVFAPFEDMLVFYPLQTNMALDDRETDGETFVGPAEESNSTWFEDMAAVPLTYSQKCW